MLLNLQLNNLVCDLPPSLFQLPRLEKLDLGSNNITLNFTQLSNAHKSNLRELRLPNTQVSSLAGIERLDGLTVFDASFSNLTGSFPSDALSPLSNLRVLSLSGNSLSGRLTASQSSDFLMGERSYLRIIRLDQNQFSGPVPAFTGMTTLMVLSLSGNGFNGTLPSDLLLRRPSDSDLPITIDLSRNRLEGTVPEELARFKVANLFLAGNRIEALPPSLCAKAGWNSGDVGRYGCDALLCPPRSRSEVGRRSPTDECRPCPAQASNADVDSSAGDAPRDSLSYMGQVSCPGITDASSAPSFRSTVSGVAAAALIWGIFAMATVC
jgi:Leucine-rich repeat (LRR) protein